MKTSKTFVFPRCGLELIGFGVLLLAGCWKEQLPAPESLAVATVRVQSIELKPHIGIEDVVGTVRPKLQSVIKAKISGQIEKMLVVPGQHVKSGEVLVQLNCAQISIASLTALAFL